MTYNGEQKIKTDAVQNKPIHMPEEKISTSPRLGSLKPSSHGYLDPPAVHFLSMEQWARVLVTYSAKNGQDP